MIQQVVIETNQREQRKLFPRVISSFSDSNFRWQSYIYRHYHESDMTDVCAACDIKHSELASLAGEYRLFIAINLNAL